jgi:hypothetical protein
VRLAQRGEFKITEMSGCSVVTSSVWGNMATYFWGLLGIDGCIQVFDGDK